MSNPVPIGKIIIPSDLQPKITADYVFQFEKKTPLVAVKDITSNFKFKIVPIDPKNKAYSTTKETTEVSLFKTDLYKMSADILNFISDKMHILGIDTDEVKYPDINSLTTEFTYKKPVFSLNDDPMGLTTTEEKVAEEWVLPYSQGFPQFINTAFKKYKLPKEVFKMSCEVENLQAFPYQYLVRDYMRFGSPNRGLLVKHGLGAGKTRTAIMVAETFREKGFRILVLTPAFLKENFILEIMKWGNQDVKLPANYNSLPMERKIIIRNALISKIKQSYCFVSTNATGKSGFEVQLAKYGIGHEMKDPDANTGYVAKYLQEQKRRGYADIKLGPPKKMLIIFEEAHNIMRTFGQSKSKLLICDLFLRAEDCKFLALSGSGLISDPFETATLLNMLTGTIIKDGTSSYIMPREKKEFDGLYTQMSDDGKNLILKNEQDLMSRMMGKISYYRGVTKDERRAIFPDLAEAIYPVIELSRNKESVESSTSSGTSGEAFYDSQVEKHIKLNDIERGVLYDPRAKKSILVSDLQYILRPIGDFKSDSRKLCNYYIPDRYLYGEDDVNFKYGITDIIQSIDVTHPAVKLLLLLLIFFDNVNSAEYIRLYSSAKIENQLSVSKLQALQATFFHKLRDLSSQTKTQNKESSKSTESITTGTIEKSFTLTADTVIHVNFLIEILRQKRMQSLYRRYKDDLSLYFNEGDFNLFQSKLQDSDTKKQRLLHMMANNSQEWLCESALRNRSPKMLAILHNLNKPEYGAPHLEPGLLAKSYDDTKKVISTEIEQELLDNIRKNDEFKDETFAPEVDPDMSNSIKQEMRDDNININDVSVNGTHLPYDHVDTNVYQKDKTTNTWQKLEQPSLSIYQSDREIEDAGMHVVGGPVLIYSEYKVLEGIGIMKLILNYHGFEQFSLNEVYGNKIETLARKRRLALITGDVPMENRVKILEVFNSKENKHGQLIRVLMITSAGSEGINLFNIRQVHIMEPYWDMERIRQTIGRSRRLCSHKYLSYEERIIYPFHYIIKFPDGISKKPTTDQWMDGIARKRDELNKKFLRCFHRAAIDSNLNMEYNLEGLTDGQKLLEIPFKFSDPRIDKPAFSLKEVSTYDPVKRYEATVKKPMRDFILITKYRMNIDLMTQSTVKTPSVTDIYINFNDRSDSQKLNNQQVLIHERINDVVAHFNKIFAPKKPLIKDNSYSLNLYTRLVAIYINKVPVANLKLDFVKKDGWNIMRCETEIIIEDLKGKYFVGDVGSKIPTESVRIKVNGTIYTAYVIHNKLNNEAPPEGYIYKMSDEEDDYKYIESAKAVLN